MLNREERGGLIWIGLFLVLLVGVIIALVVRADPAQPRTAHAHRTQLKIGRASGRLVDARTGKPLSPPVVEVESLDGLSSHWLEEPSLEDPGRFGLRGLPAGGPYTLRLRSDGYETVTHPILVRSGETTEMGDVALRPLIPVTGRVLDSRGLPAADARVRLTTDPGSANGPAPPEDPAETRTGPGGQFEFTRIAAPVRISAFTDGARTRFETSIDLWDPAAHEPVVLELDELLELRGHVMTLPFPGRVRSGDAEASVSDDGSFKLEGLFRGANWIEFDTDVGETTAVRCWISGSEHRTVELPDLRTFPLRIAERPGNVRIAVQSTRTDTLGDVQWSSRFATETSGAGPWTVNLRPGSASRALVWSQDGGVAVQDFEWTGEHVELSMTWAPDSPPVDPLDGAVRLLDAEVGPSFDASDWSIGQPLDAVLYVEGDPRLPWARRSWWDGPHESAPVLRGQVHGRAGQPITDAAVSLLATCDGTTHLVGRTRTNSGGQFHLRFPAGRAELYIVVEARDRALALHAVESAEPIELVLLPGRELALQCVDEDGAPLPDVRVSLPLSPAIPADPLSPHLRGARLLVTDSSGLVRFRHLGEGEWTPMFPGGETPVDPGSFLATLPIETATQTVVLQTRPDPEQP